MAKVEITDAWTRVDNALMTDGAADVMVDGSTYLMQSERTSCLLADGSAVPVSGDKAIHLQTAVQGNPHEKILYKKEAGTNLYARSVGGAAVVKAVVSF